VTAHCSLDGLCSADIAELAAISAEGGRSFAPGSAGPRRIETLASPCRLHSGFALRRLRARHGLHPAARGRHADSDAGGELDNPGYGGTTAAASRSRARAQVMLTG